MEGFPMRKWNIEIWLLNEAGEEVQADVFDKVVYELHPSFAKPKQSMFLTFSRRFSVFQSSGTVRGGSPDLKSGNIR
jgi:hypothetical protein